MKANACAFQGGAGVLSRVNSTGRWRSRGRGKQEGQDLELGPPPEPWARVQGLVRAVDRKPPLQGVGKARS